MKRKTVCSALILAVFCFMICAPAFAAEESMQIGRPAEAVQTDMGALCEIHLPWITKPGAETDFGQLSVRSRSEDGPEVSWGAVTADGVTGTVRIPGAPIARVTYMYVAELYRGEVRVGSPTVFQIEAHAPQIRPVTGVQKVQGGTAEVRIVWAPEHEPASGTDLSRWSVISSSETEHAPQIEWAALGADGAIGRLEVPDDAPNGTKYEYTVSIEDNGTRVGTYTTLTAVVQRQDTAFAAPAPFAAAAGQTLTLHLDWSSAYKPAAGADLSGWQVLYDGKDMPPITWTSLTDNGAEGTLQIPNDTTAGTQYTYSVGAAKGGEQQGGPVTVTVTVADLKLENQKSVAFAGQTAVVEMGWADGVEMPAGTDLSMYAVRPVSENAPEGKWTLGPQGVTAQIAVPKDAAPGTTYTYMVSLLEGEEPIGEPAELAITIMAGQLREPDPVTIPAGATAELELLWMPDEAPSSDLDLSRWGVVSESTSGPGILWNAVQTTGIRGEVTLPADAVPGTEYTYAVHVSNDAVQYVGDPVTFTIIVGAPVTGSLTASPAEIETAQGATGVTVVVEDNKEPAYGGWWDLQPGAPEGASLALLGITDINENPVHIAAAKDAPAGTYTLIYHKDVESATVTVVVRPQSQGALIAPAPESGLAVTTDPRLGEIIVSGIPISGTNDLYTVKMLMENLVVPEGSALHVLEADGEHEATEDRAVGTGLIVQVVQGGQVMETTRTLVSGDVTGAGIISITQLVRMAQSLTGTQPLEGIYLAAGCIAGGDEITLTDLIREAQTLREFS